jgi:GH25 family lysozyme M1 (1,4-beta-N-acetylmuramidase)
MLPLDRVLARTTVARLHPEFRRRVIALMKFAAMNGKALGVGTGWRIQPDPPPPGFARPGNSNHESFPAGSNSPTAVAADMVPNSSWNWMEANVAKFGLKTFRNVNNEPWHIQPVEIPNSRNWRRDPWSLPAFNLPAVVDPGVEQPPPPATDDYVKVIDTSAWQFPGFDSAAMTLPANTTPPDLAKAKALGVSGVYARALNGVRKDPAFDITVFTAKAAGLAIGAYHYLRPNESSPEVAADAVIAEVTKFGLILPVMADCESFEGEDTWSNRQYADWLHVYLDRIEGTLNKRPIIYTGDWWWNRELGAVVGAEFAKYDFMLSDYVGTTPPSDASQWYNYATSGTRKGPDIVAGDTTWEGWQFTSKLRAGDFGFAPGDLDGNLVKPTAWWNWNIPATAPPPPPVPGSTWVDVTIGQSGPRVVEVQYALTSKGFPPFGGCDGEYGIHTAAKVGDFQLSRGLPLRNTVVDTATAAALGFEVAPPPPPPPPTPPPPTPSGTNEVSIANLPTVREGDRNKYARKVQALLNAYEVQNGRKAVVVEDGYFGPASAAVLRTTQARLGFKGGDVDAICGPATWRRLLEA